ncbi:flavin reductase family protein [Longispora albida]|uniref:flavin reductase family protein n=1 Tax=Longispora albida TaxID=203523 RepID=UPI0024809C98|nr:flavin reductase family protein [Longispora albida]
MSRFVTGLAVVTARQPSGQPCGLLVSSLSSYSVSPPSVLFSIGDQRASYDTFVQCTRFAVHLLGAEHEAIARTFADPHTDRFTDLAWRWEGGLPRLAAPPVFFACARAGTFPHGDHAVVIGEILRMSAHAGDPLVYYRRQFDWRLARAHVQI